MRRTKPIALLLGGMLLVFESGCTNVQLRNDSVKQARTLSEIYEQQVLDNLAKFVYDPYSMPHFAVATEGSATIGDQINGNGNAGWTKGGVLNAAGFQVGGMRTVTEVWTLNPISDPRKLELMRCAYQRARRACLNGGETCCCPDCQKLINQFYTGDASKTPTEALAEMKRRHGEAQERCCPAQVCAETMDKSVEKAATPPADKQQEQLDLYGVTADCLYPPNGCCWFRVCCAKCIGKHHHQCCRVAEHCGVFIVVEPGIGQEMLSRLTLVMLDFAQYEGAKPPVAVDGQRACLSQQRRDAVNRLIEVQCRLIDIDSKLQKTLPGGKEDPELLRQRDMAVTQAKRWTDLIAQIDKLLPAPTATPTATAQRQLDPNSQGWMLQFKQGLNAAGGPSIQ